MTRAKYWKAFALTLLLNGNASANEKSWLDHVGAREVGANETWILVNSEKRKLQVMRGHQPIKVLRDVSVGASGASPHRLQGSEITPKGEFRIDAINEQSRFRTFYRFDYPTPDHARQAYLDGTFSYEDYLNYYTYRERHRSPPQHTALGGQIGLHGLGGRDEYIHRRINWTEGCVAVSDREIDQLAPYLSVGTRIIVE